ncbi:hypothetical protein GX50_06880 [[Emmonsia] crescens]|uniref:Uncharacterized protein n=1 Tax=[Emmonsia] crescens TaxID=73230 RepID=A0A2B7ZAG2_9EURO|nr:hypothetical protein GX50_06880 [Emmonsia crescens]
MPSRSSSKTTERASAMNAAAAAFSPTALTVFQPANSNMSIAGSDAADFAPNEYVNDGEDVMTLSTCPEPFEFTRVEPTNGEIERDVFQIQNEAMGLHAAHRLEVEKLTLGLSLEIEQLKQELNTIRSLNGNGNGNRNAVGEGGEEPPACAEKDNQDTNGSIEEAEKPDAEAVVGKKIIAFLRLTKDVPYPHRLYGKSNYSIWRESILSIAEATGCNYIIDDGQKFCPFIDENTYLWDQQNDWLYDLIWDSIGSQAMESVTQPKRHSAYLLWNQLESTFRRPLEEERRSIFHSLYPSQKISDREYIKKFQEARKKLEKLGFPVPDWLLYDILYESVSSSSRNTIHANFKLKQEETPKSVPQTLDIDTLIDELVACLPPDGNIVISTISNSDSNTDLSPITSPSTPYTAVSSGVGSASADNINNNDTVSTHSGTTRSSSKNKKENSQQSSNPNNTNDNNTIIRNGSSDRRDENPEPFSQPGAECEFCRRRNHTQSGCFIKNPELAPEGWRLQRQRIAELSHQKVVEQRQKQNQNSAPRAPQPHSNTRGRGRQKGNNYNNNSSSKSGTGSQSPANVNMSQSIQSIARQFYEQMDNEV